ncbi:MAG: pyruvate dehydrogenase complex dihydrolipoamide acetyltransferase, partial [Pseudomonadota bacterium]
EGVVGKIVVAEGSENVKVNVPIAFLLEEGESADDIDASASAPTPPKAAPAQAAPAKSNGAEPAPAPQPAPAAPAAQATTAASTGDRVLASPLAKRIAKEEGLELSGVKGTGPHGRIVKRDIEQALKDGTGKATPAPAAKPAQAPAAGVDERLYPADSYETVKVDGMRKVIARRLTQSFNREVPHFPLTIDCELDRLLAARKNINASAPEGEGAYKISVNDLIIKASAMALIKVPAANATYTDEAILLHKNADIGVAVAIDGGLITPIIWKAEEKGLAQISAEMKDLAARAKTRKLKPNEYQGGTFSISNLGMFGVKSFASIINQPQGAIMSVGAGEQRPVVKNGELAVATVMSVTLTCDHRVVDGAVGAEFLAAFKTFIEDPVTMLV